MTDFIARHHAHVPAETCEALIQLFRDADKRKATHQGLTGVRVDKARKDSLDLASAKIPPKLREKYAAPLEQYFTLLGEAHKAYVERYTELQYPRTFEHGVYSFNIQRYYPGGQAYHAWHYENAHPKAAHRILAWMTYLNTVASGGETEFLHQGLKVHPEQGLTLIWPAGFTHTHRGLPHRDGLKLIITGWFEYAPRGRGG
ncbi:hypothetical protein CKO31_24495 [Thiohalocapsa halophila]|uniref:Fe2OG dioxygenase domain-containing protein n=2 Tax=Thiohalocapsa halophila TaxID=69359 RepID=A0ABS1CQQ8_9GAMM|nr:hypothetical protein [Thiohalocapsa halophila]